MRMYLRFEKVVGVLVLRIFVALLIMSAKSI